jgi:hypothetical protein
MTFVRGTDERAVLTGLGVDPDDAMPATDPEFSSTLGVALIRSGGWLVALEQTAWPRGIRPDVLRRLSAGTEAVVIHEDIAKGNHEFAHAADGEIITAVMTTAPPSWGGTQPDRLRPLAEELGMDRGDGSPGPDYDYDYDYDLGDLEILLLIAEVAFGLSLDEADLNSPLLKVPDQPADPTNSRLKSQRRRHPRERHEAASPGERLPVPVASECTSRVKHGNQERQGRVLEGEPGGHRSDPRDEPQPALAAGDDHDPGRQQHQGHTEPVGHIKEEHPGEEAVERREQRRC